MQVILVLLQILSQETNSDGNVIRAQQSGREIVRSILFGVTLIELFAWLMCYLMWWVVTYFLGCNFVSHI